MKSKRIAAVVAVALTGTYVIPTNAIASKVSNEIVLAQNTQNKDSNGKNGMNNNSNKGNNDSKSKESNNLKVNNSKEQNYENNSTEKPEILSALTGLEATTIEFYNIWGGDSVNLSFNINTMKMEAVRKSGDLGTGNNNYLKFVYYNSQSGDLSSQEVKDGSSSNLSTILNNKSFNYGDVIGIEFQEGSEAPKMSNGNSISQNGEMEYFEITANGLVNYKPKVTVNTLPIINGNKITETTVTGSGAANEKVTAIVNGQVFTGETDQNGNFNLNITDDSGFTESTKINLEIPSKVGLVEKTISPTLTKNITISKNQIILNNVWNQSVGTISFNPTNKTIEFNDGWSYINPYLPSTSEAFGITLYNKTGALMKSTKVYGGEYPQKALSEFLNNQPYQYGEYIEIDYKTSSNINITNFDGESDFKVNKPIIVQITKSGLKESTIQSVNANPFDVLDGLTKVTTGTITGKVNPNEIVTATVNGKNFSAISNVEGFYSIKVADENGFTKLTNIELNADGYLPKTISPVLNDNLEIRFSSIDFNNENNQSMGTLSFNPGNQRIEFSGSGATASNGFIVSLYNKNGIVIANAKIAAGENLNTAISNLLNNKVYQYGEYIGINYLNGEQSNITVGNNIFILPSYRVKGNEIFKITEKGLIKSTLNVVPASNFDVLEGTTEVTRGIITGKVRPNESVTATVNGKTFLGKANNAGDYSINLEDKSGFTKNTEVELNAVGYFTNYITPTLNTDIKVQGSTISFSNNWKQNIGTIEFNPNNQAIEFKAGWAGTNPYAANSQETFGISLYNNNGRLIKSTKVYGSSYPENQLANFFNNITYKYGEYIELDYVVSTNINVKNTSGEGNYLVKKPMIFKITKSGLKVANIVKVPANPFAVLEGPNNKVTTGILTGKVNPNEVVTALVNGKSFETKSNNEGEYSLKLQDENGFNINSNIEINANGYLPSYIKPIIANNIKIGGTTISFSNNWHQNIGTIEFKPNNQSIEFKSGGAGTNPYVAGTKETFGISLYNNNGSLIKSIKAYGSSYPENSLDNFFKNTNYKYGEYIELDQVDSTNIVINSGNKESEYTVKKPMIFKITKDGLKVANIVKVPSNPFDILEGPDNKVITGVLTGKVNPNEKVIATVNGKSFETKANNKGEYSLKLEDKNGFNKTTKIELNSNGYLPSYINPVINENVKIGNSTITFKDNYSATIGVIAFNPTNQTINFENGGASVNPYVYPTTKVFKVSLYNAEGAIEGSVTAYGSSYPQKALEALLNNKHYQYGSYIKITHYDSTGIYINNPNSGNNYQVTGTTVVELTKTGLVQSNIPTMKVNPFGVLGNGNVYSGTITGEAPANKEVTAIINGKTFSTIADANGKFALRVSDENGFKDNTEINLWTAGELGVQIEPVIPSTWGINGAELELPDNCLGIAQTITFNPNTMTISNLGNSFAAQLVDGSTGNVVASIGNSNFNVFTSKNNLNGATFKFGDIINIYESEETYLSDGGINLTSNGQTSTISPINKFQSFEITKNGLVPVANKNLTDVNALFNGNNQIVVSGKTTANTNVKISYGNDLNKIVKSNSDGDFSLTLPLDDAAIGSEVRTFVNDENAKAVIVSYNSKVYNVNNSIQLINDESVPVIDITFSPVSKTINSLVYPRDKTYAGVFYGNRMNLSLLDGKTGAVIKSATSEKPGEIQSFSNQLNGLHYKNGDIIKIQYDSSLGAVNVSNDNKEIGNSNGDTEYFEITNKGLVNVTNNFIKVNPLDILGNGNLTKANVTGTVKPNEQVTATVNGENFKGIADSTGKFTIAIEDEKNFNSNTEITLNANGFVPTTIKPTVGSNIALTNSYINFYENSYNWEATSLCSSIGFNVNNNSFYVNNYENNFGAGNSKYFTLNLYNSNGEKLFGKSFTGASTKALSEFLNGKSFNYGDVVELTYNPSVYKPVVINGSTAIGNLTGEKEYFEITKDGLKSINFGNNGFLTNLGWNDGNLEISANLISGNSAAVKNDSKKIVLLDSKGNIIASETAKTSDLNGQTEVTAQLTANDLAKITSGEEYTIAFESGDTIISLYSNINTASSKNYLITASSVDKLGISKKGNSYENIKNSADIGNYLNSLSEEVKKVPLAELSNSSNKNKVLANAFINRIGVANLEAFYKDSSQNAQFLNWVLNNSTAMEEFLSGPNPEGPNIAEGQPAATYSECLQVWSNIWNTYTTSHTGFNLKIAIAVSLTNGQPIPAFPAYYENVGSPVQRYKVFETLNAENGMMPGFNKLNVSELCYVTNTDIANNQIVEMRSIILQNHNGLITPKELENVAYTINYNTRNPHTGVSVFNYPNFYGPNPTIKTVWYDGGVCGATGRMGAAAEQVFGVPAAQTPQPGHNAFIYYDSLNNTWQQGNNLEGWNQTYDADISGWSDILSPKDNAVASYTVLYQAANNGNLSESNMYLYLAEGESNYDNKLQAINKAIKVDKLNLGAWIELADLYHSNPKTTMAQYNELANEVTTVFDNYSVPLTNMIHYIYSPLLQRTINNVENDVYNIDYTMIGRNNLQLAINNAEPIVSNPNATKTEILAAINNINIATSKLSANIGNLEKVIGEANKLVGESIYTVASRENLEQAINSAEKVARKPEVTLSEVTVAINNLRTAAGHLTLNNNTLLPLIQRAKTLVNNSVYTVASRSNLQQAIAEGDNLLNDPTAPTVLVNAVENALKTAISNLKFVNAKDSTVIKLKLQSELENDITLGNKAVVNNGYTVASKMALINAITSSKNTLNNESSTIEELSNAINNLEIAYNNLVINKGELDHEIETAKGLVNNSKYTLASRKHLEITIKSAENIYNSKNSTATAVENAVNELEQSIRGLKINEVTVKNNAEAVYFITISGEKAIVINGNLQGAKKVEHSMEKQLVIENANGEIVSTINTAAVNWYSKNSKDYSGYQGIITESVLSKLKVGESYKVGIKFDGKVELLNSTISLPSNSKYNIKNNNGNVVIVRNNISEPAVANYETAYEYNGGFIINGNVNLNGENISKKIEKEIVITDNEGNVVYENNTVPVNWYSGNATNYSGFQAYIPKGELDKLSEGDYKISMVVNEAGKKYSMNIEGAAVSVTSDGFNITMKGNYLMLNKEESLSGTATIENKYIDGENTVINAKMNLDSVPVGSKTTMEVLENKGEINTVKGVLVDWYSNNKSNLNGAQFIVNTKALENSKSLKVLVTVGNKEYTLTLN